MGERPKFNTPRVKRYHGHKYRHPQGHRQGIAHVRRPEIKARFPLEIFSARRAPFVHLGGAPKLVGVGLYKQMGLSTLRTAVSKHPDQSRHGQMWLNFDRAV